MPALAKLRERTPGVSSLPPALLKSAVPVVAIAAVVTAVVLVFAWSDQASYKPVFGARQAVSAADVMAVLDAEKLPYRIHPETGQVLVASDKLGKVRMTLAAKGVVAKLPAGLELMDKSDPLGVSQFVQDIRFRRGLEGELTQSILALDPVEAVRVHLSIAKSSSFVVSDGEKSSASVVLTLKQGRTLGQEQIAAVINMVAGSVASLDPQRVSVVDQAGRLLSARVDLSDGFEGNSRSEAAKQFQDDVRRNVNDLLAPVVGEDNYKLSVTAEVDIDKVQETHEKYGTAPKVTNEAMREETERDEMAVGVPGSLSNRPVAAAAAAAASGPGASDKKSATTRNYAYDRSITQIKRSKGRLARMNVAVVLNSSAVPGGKKDWEPAELDKVKDLLASGLGIDDGRGDKLTLTILPFPAKAAATPWYFERHNIEDAVMAGLYALAALLAFFLVLRPLTRGLLRWMDSGSQVREKVAAIAGAPETLAAAAAAGPKPAPRRAGEVLASLVADYDLPPPGSPVDDMVDHLKALAEKEPGRVAEVLTQWVQKNERTEDGN